MHPVALAMPLPYRKVNLMAKPPYGKLYLVNGKVITPHRIVSPEESAWMGSALGMSLPWPMPIFPKAMVIDVEVRGSFRYIDMHIHGGGARLYGCKR